MNWKTQAYIRYTSPGWGLSAPMWRETEKRITEDQFWQMLSNIRRLDRLLKMKPTKPTVLKQEGRLIYKYVIRYDRDVATGWRYYPAEEAYLIKVRRT